MTKHVLDQSRSRTPKCEIRQYVRIEREAGPEGSHKASKSVHRRASERGLSQRLKQFARIERGVEA